MSPRGTLLTSFFALLVAAGGAGCGGPHKGKPEKVPKVKRDKKGEEAALAADQGGAQPDIVWKDECEAKFTEDPNKAKRSASAARPKVDAGNDQLSSARGAADPATKVSLIIAGIEQYKKALLEDHYNPDATYQLAVAYATVRRRGCALRMLKRLAELQINPKLAGGEARLDGLLRAVEDEPAFQPFKKEAMEAIGR